MPTDFIPQAQAEYVAKSKLGNSISQYYRDKVTELNLQDFSRIKAYLEAFLPDQNLLLNRDIIFAHHSFEPFTTLIAEGKPFTVVSGLNPSSPLHLGHKVLFDLLLFLQKLGADIFIPITNDESYVDGKVTSLAESRRIAYEDIIPSIIAFGFDPQKTKLFVMSDYPEVYNLAMHISKQVTNKYASTVFGDEGIDNSGKAFYRSAVQLAQILLPQLPEFGGTKNTLIPVGIDQHPYILVARDVARKMGFVPPAELVFKFQNSLLDPFKKMSGSKPKTAIYLNDAPEGITAKIQKAYTGAVSILEVHQKLGGVPEAWSVFSLLNFHHPDKDFVSNLYKRYRAGTLTMKELKEVTTQVIIQITTAHQAKKATVSNVQDFLLKTPLVSLLSI